jgi:hypothetical protein
VYLVFGLAIWSQLYVGWRWSKPEAPATYSAMAIMTVGLILVAVVVGAASAPIVWTVISRFARRKAPGLLQPSMVFTAGLAFVVLGAHHFQNGWPGTGGHRWADQRVVPGGVAAFVWSSTLSITSYWAHPSSLRAFPVGELLWMLLSPVAIAGLVAGTVQTIRRLELPPALVRYEGRLCRIAVGGLGVFLFGVTMWMVDGGSGPADLFHVGVIDVVGLLTMVAMQVSAWGAVRLVGP